MCVCCARALLQMGSELTHNLEILPPYALGTKRSLDDFCTESGLDLTARSVSEKAKYSGLQRSSFFQNESDLLDILKLVAANS